MPDRRSFIKNMATLGIFSSIQSTFPEITRFDFAFAAKKNRLHVHYEWGKLEEVIVGYPYLRIGGAMPKAVGKFLRHNPKTAQLKQAWLEADSKLPLEKFAPELAKQNEQMNAAITILKDRGIRVHQVDRINDSELAFEEKIGSACLQQFVRDPILVIGDRYIELPLYMPYRRKERFPIRRTLESRLNDLQASIISAPEPYPLPEDAQGNFGSSAFLEGGDILLFGKEVYVGNSGNASNRKGIAWLQTQLGSGYRVHEVRMSNAFLHLDCGLCTPRPGLAIICREAFPDGLPDCIKGWELIEVNKEDAEMKMACNGLILDQKSILIGSENTLLADKLDKAGLNVYTTPFDMVTPLGGGFRCWHHPLIRI